MLDDWRAAEVPSRVRAVLPFLEKLCARPADVGPEDLAALRAAGLSDADLRDVGFITYLFTMYDKMSDTLAWAPLDDAGYAASADHLLKRGYGAARDRGDLRRALEDAVLRGAGSTDPALRAAAEAGAEVPEDVRQLLDKVRRHAYQVTDADVAAARRGRTEDELFELFLATILGEARRRLDRVLELAGAARPKVA